MEPEDTCLESTVHTNEVACSRQQSSPEVSYQLNKMKELSRTIQLLNISLSQKNFIMDSMKADYLSKIEDLEERLKDALLQKQILDLRLASQVSLAQEELRKQTRLHKQEVEAVVARKQQLEELNRHLCQNASEGWESIQDLDLSGQRCQELLELPDENISIQEYVAMRFYEAVSPLRFQLAELSLERDRAVEELDTSRGHMKGLVKSYEEERRIRTELELRCQRLTLELADNQQQFQRGDCRRDDYPSDSRKRDSSKVELEDLQRRSETPDATRAAVSREGKALRKEVATLRQSAAVLLKDKEHLHRRNFELGIRLAQKDDRLDRLQAELEDTKMAREDFEKYAASRDQYERKLKEELERVRVKTNLEIDNLQRSYKEMYERENRMLQEDRDHAVLEKDRVVAAEREIQSRYNQLLERFRQLQLGSDSRMAEMSRQARLQALEAERALLGKEETTKALVQRHTECEKQQKNLDLLNQKFSSLQRSAEERTAQLRAQVAGQASRLETYEGLERDLDQISLQAAETQRGGAERDLFSDHPSAHVPPATSVRLARRALCLKRQNPSLQRELDSHRLKSQLTAEEILAADQWLEWTQQPYSYLVEALRQRDAQIRALKDTIDSLEGSSPRKEQAGEVKNRMAADLKRLFRNKEELPVMEVLLGMDSKDGRGRPSGKQVNTANQWSPKKKTSKKNKVPGLHQEMKETGN